MKKVLCFFIGHKLILQKCPVTNIKIEYCLRCSPSLHDSGMSFK